MSSICRILLRRAFCTATFEPSINSASTKGVLSEYGSLKRLVERFKKYSGNTRFRTNIAIYEDVVRRLTSAKCFNWVEEILEDQKQYKEISKEGFNARLITLYGKAGMLHKAHQVFDEIPSRNCKRTALSFNALLSACVNSRNVDKFDELFKDLPMKIGIQPDVVSYNTLMKAYFEMGSNSIELAVCLLKEMESKGLVPNVITYNTLLNGLYANGRFDDGERIWEQMIERNVSPDIRNYNAKLLGLSSASSSMAKECIDLLDEMRKKEIKPDAISFSCLISGFVAEDDVEEVKRWYREMKEAGFKPDCYKLGCTIAKLVRFACEKDDLGFAVEVAKDILSARRVVNGDALLQQVVDGLAKESKVEEAEEIVRLAKMNGYFHCRHQIQCR
ncbi:Pentatricopeptide repeat-containing protein At3g13160, mitochondrial [Linum perenne]